jgi:hypothetical protein
LRFFPAHSAMRDEATCYVSNTWAHSVEDVCASSEAGSSSVEPTSTGFATFYCWSVNREVFLSVRTFSPMNFSKNVCSFELREIEVTECVKS